MMIESASQLLEYRVCERAEPPLQVFLAVAAVMYLYEMRFCTAPSLQLDVFPEQIFFLLGRVRKLNSRFLFQFSHVCVTKNRAY
jgi:hypothetical protein